MTAPAVFAADLHLLPGSQPEQNRRLAAFLEKLRGETEALYLLGDIFHCWYERPRRGYAGDYREVCALLRSCSEHRLPVFFLPGNRDFAMGRVLARETCGQVLADTAVVETGGKRILLTHGDLLCTLDTGYLRLRRFFTGPLGQTLLPLLPWRAAVAITVHVQNKYKLIVDRQPAERYDLQDAACAELLTRNSADTLICGHIHHRSERSVRLPSGRQGRVYTLPPWREKGGYLELDAKGLRFAEAGTGA